MHYCSSNTTTTHNSEQMEATMSTIAAMRRQEETGYLKNDDDSVYRQSPLLQTTDAAGTAAAPAAPIDMECRNRMVAWSFQAVDSLRFDRETVTISLSYLDRFLATPAGAAARADRKAFQLAAMTSLYTAIKIYEPVVMAPTMLSNLSRGVFSVKDIENMESKMLMALQWRVNPPTALGFVREMLNLIPETDLDAQFRLAVYNVAKYQTELSVRDGKLLAVKESTIALCSLLSSLEFVGLDDQKQLGHLAYVLSLALDVETTTQLDNSFWKIQKGLSAAVASLPAGTFDIPKGRPFSSPMAEKLQNDADSRQNPAFESKQVSVAAVSA